MTLSQMQYYKQQKGYSFAKLSELSGVPVGTIQKIFNGETKSPRYDTLQALERVLKPEEEVFCLKETAVEYQVEKKLHTLDDYYLLPADQRVELIDGVFYDMAAPTVIHQVFCMQLTSIIYNYIQEKKGKCLVLPSPVDVQLDCDDKTMVQPDVIVVCDHDKIINRCIMGAPDFVIEILSTSTLKKDMILKLGKYMNAGVREYWMVDAKKERIITYFFDEDYGPTIYGIDDKVPVGIFEGELQIDFKEIREYLKGYGNLEEE